MRTLPLSRKHPAGGVMVIALVAIGIITVGFAAWVGLLSQRGRAAEIEEHATRRRVAGYNSRAAIREYAFERMITSTGDNNGVAFDPFESEPEIDPVTKRPLKGMTVTSAAPWTGYAMQSNTRLAGLNAFSLSWDYPYSKVIDTTAATKALGFVTNAAGRVEQDYTSIASFVKTYVRSRCPVLGGDLLIVHRSKMVPETAPVVSGNISVNGRVMHFVPELPEASYSARSVRFVACPGVSPMGLRPKNLSGEDLPPSNMAWTPVTFGRVNASTDLTGKLNVIDVAANDESGNSLRQKLTASAATLQSNGGTAMVDPRGLNNDGLGTVTVTACVGPSNPADLPSVIIADEVTELIIEGQDGTNYTDYARYRPAFAVVYVQDPLSVRKLTTIRLRKQNSRRMVLAIKQAGIAAGTPVNVVVEDTNAASNWNVVILAENTPLVFSAGAPVTSIRLTGGIQIDSPLTGPGAGQTLVLAMELDTRGLIRLTPRAAWVETIMPDKVPGSTADNTW